MKISIIGAGAVGGYFGAKFSIAGNEVVFISKGKNLETYRKIGLRLETESKSYLITDAIFTDQYNEITNSDYVIITVKSYDTDTVAKQIKPYINSHTLVITIQNGINNDTKLASIIGKKNIIPGMTKVAVSTPEPGLIKHTSMGIIIVGEYNGEVSQRLQNFASVCEKSNIGCEISRQILKDRWDKYIWNCTYNIISTIYKLDLRELLANKEIKQLSIDCLKELYKLAKEEGFDFDVEKAIQGKLEYTFNLGKFETSTLQDYNKGKPIELDAFTGYVLKLAEKHNLEMPINQKLYKQLKELTN